MPYPQFDRARLKILPLSERKSDLDIALFPKKGDVPPPFDHPALDALARNIVSARQKDAAVLLMYGAHVIRSGCAAYMIELMERGLLTHLATNGAGSIHDYELAMAGRTCESVARYVSEGQFGLWKESGRLNDIVREGAEDGLGFGEAVGRAIWEGNMPHRDRSVLAAGYRLGIPCTVHVGIGNDIVHEHPNCDGAAVGRASYTDFLVYAQSATRLEGGVFLNFGSAVTGPEVYLKALAMARNVAHQEGKRIAHFSTAVFDLLDIDEKAGNAPAKSDPRYYFRPWKTILDRTVADGGQSYYVQGEHRLTLPNLAVKTLKEAGEAIWTSK